jgi:multiple sugar transport system substrate-binding protein
MSLTKLPAKAFAVLVLAVLAILSVRMPGLRHTKELTILVAPDGTGIYRELTAEFNRRATDFHVSLVEGPPSTNGREDLYSTSFLSGKSAYDIVSCDVVWTAKFAAAGWLLDLSNYLSQQDAEKFLETDLKAGMYRGKLYRIPASTDAGLLYYRKDLVPHPPRTFEELVAQARKHQTKDRWGFLWQGKQYEGLVTVFLEVLWGFGGEWIDDRTRQVLLDRPEAIEALSFLKDTIGDISPRGVTTYMEEDTRLLFQNGRAVFMRNWPYVWSLLQQNSPSMAERVAFTSMVGTSGNPGAATLGGWGYAVSSFCPEPENAWAYIEFMTRPEQLKQIQRRAGLIPARKALIPAEFAPIVRNVRMRPLIPEYAQASDILQRWLSAALTGRTSCEIALKKAATETRALLKSEIR